MAGTSRRRGRETRDGHKDGREARGGMSREQRAERDAVIMQYYIGGYSQYWIARHPKVQLSQERVGQIIRNELKKLAKQQEVAGEQAMTIYVARLETLIRRVWPKVEDNDPERAHLQLKAIETGRRLLEQYARLYDLNEERQPLMVPPMSEDELDMVEEGSPAFEQLDEMTKYRLKQHRKERDTG